MNSPSTLIAPICTPPIGTTASFAQPWGDHYAGRVTGWNGSVVTLVDFSQWVDGAVSVYHCPHSDDAVSVLVLPETVIEVIPVQAVCRRCRGRFVSYGPSDGLCCLRACSDAPHAAVPAQRLAVA